MTDTPIRSVPWPDGYDVLAFCAATAAFVFVGIAVLSALFQAPPQEQTLFRYGGTAVLVWLLVAGTVSFLAGGYAAAMVPMTPPGAGSKALVLVILLFPAAGLFLGALALKRAPAQ